MLDKTASKKLLKLAREAVAAAVSGKPIPESRVEDESLQARCGVFVTLKTDGRLRGCLGRFSSEKPLWRTVREMAAAAATEDPRFIANRISPEEVGDVEIEISVLSPLEKTDRPLKDMKLGIHGIYIRAGGQSGCFLPQVAEEMGWDKETFLDNCCRHKAGLPAGAWRDNPDVEIHLFTAEIISSAD